MSLYSTLKNNVIRYFVPTLSAISRLITSPGLTAFAMQKTVIYFSKLFSGSEQLLAQQTDLTALNNNNSTAILLMFSAEQNQQNTLQDDALPDLGYFILLFYALPICSNVFINLVTRIPPLYRDRTITSDTREPYRSTANKYVYNIMFHSLSAMGLCSVLFTIPNAYLGGKKLLKVATGDDISELQGMLIEGVALIAAASSFNINYSYTYPSFKTNAKKFTVFLLDGPNRLIGITQYGKTLSLCFFNIISDPCIAYFSTYNAFKNMPIQSLFSEGTLRKTAGYSTITSFTSNVFTSVPSVHAYFNQDLNAQDRAKMEVMEAMPSIQVFLRLSRFFGFIDSVATGLSSYISVVATVQTLFSLNSHFAQMIPEFILEPKLPPSDLMPDDDWNIALRVFAAACAASKALSNQAFSVERGIKDTIIKDLYPFYLKRNWVNPPRGTYIPLQDVHIDQNRQDKDSSDDDTPPIAPKKNQYSSLYADPLLPQEHSTQKTTSSTRRNTIFSHLQHQNANTANQSNYTPPTPRISPTSSLP